jgi:3-carboxy-cis,cis-muconate cycloisomerase
MRPSSSPSEPPAGALPAGPAGAAAADRARGAAAGPDPPGLFDGVLARGAVRTAVADRAWLAAMLEVEAALARVQARAGVIPAEAAERIAAACRPERYDAAALGEAAAGSGNPVVPLVTALRAAAGPKAAEHVHHGATSQDILDTAAMLVAYRALGPLLDDLRGAADAAAELARAHRGTPMPGRTLLQQAVPVTFGLLAAGWLTALDGAADWLERLRHTRLAVQLGGPAGTLAGIGGGPAGTLAGIGGGREGAPGDRGGLDLPAALAGELGLAVPVLPWHTDRTRIAELAGALGTAAGALGKVARDVTLLAQTELGEVSEGRPGGSSSMPHKRNPVAAVSALAAAAQAPGLVATLLAAMPQELQRAAGGWHAEWRALRELLVSTGSAAAWVRACLTGLEVHLERMLANLAGTAADPTGTAEAPGAAESLVDRALAAHHGTDRRWAGAPPADPLWAGDAPADPLWAGDAPADPPSDAPGGAV